MLDRINALANKTLKGEMYVKSVETQYDREDIFLSPVKMQAKRTKEYILNQEPLVLPECALTGFITFDGSIPGEIFNRRGHKNFENLMHNFYNQPFRNLTTFEWQHSVADYQKVIRIGIAGLIEEIHISKSKHIDPERIEFLDALETVAETMIGWAQKCADKADKVAEETTVVEYKNNLKKLSAALRRVPQNPANNFFEAILTVYLVYAFVPDSIGTIDRYLYPFYVKDIANGDLTQEEAKAYLQELYLMLQARVSIDSDRFTRGGESHFCIGGYLPNGEDGFNDLSRLALDSLMELPTYIPQISLRWTKKTPREILRYALDCERKDHSKRIAFVSDEPRIKGLMEYGELSYEEAVSYTMVGCNEPALPGGQMLGVDASNAARCIDTIFHKKSDEVVLAETFEQFYSIFEREFASDIAEMIEISTNFQKIRAKDCNIVSSMFFAGCIENAKSMTEQDSMTRYSVLLDIMGLTTVIDCVISVKQFVYDEKKLSIAELVNALKANWEGYEHIRSMIVKKAHYFGNDDDYSNEVAEMVSETLRKILDNKDNYWKKKLLVGDLTGYNQHNTWFGNNMGATPDGRRAGDPISFGRGQSEGRDRNGLTALMNSIVKYDKNCIMVGPSVTNMLLEEKLLTDDESFEKMVTMLEAYFESGGLHAQLNYVSLETLKDAKVNPEKHNNLRVRVSGFSDYFNNLNSDLQDEIVTRTANKV